MSREVMQQALDALNESLDLVENEHFHADAMYRDYPSRRGDIDRLKAEADLHDAAITALEVALAQPATVEPLAWIEHHKAGDNLNWEPVDHPYAKATPLCACAATQPSQPVQLTESEKHSFVRSTLKHHGITHHVHTALVADLIYGLEALAQPASRCGVEESVQQNNQVAR